MMKKHSCLFFLVFLSFYAFGQTITNKQTDTVRVYLSDRNTPVTPGHEPLYVVNEKIAKEQLNGINPKDILSIDILKDSPATEIYGEQGKNGVVKVITISFAVKQYQEKFSLFSRKYKKYLEINQDNNRDIVYVLNGVRLQDIKGDFKSPNIKSILYKIQVNNIRSVKFMNKFDRGLNNSQAILSITTGQ